MSLARELFLGFIKVHILYHAVQEPIYGLRLMETLLRRGYTFSAVSLYPMLHSLEAQGLLVSQKSVIAGKARRCYSLTRTGRRALRQARAGLWSY